MQVYSEVTIENVIPTGTLGHVIFKTAEGKTKVVHAEWRVARDIAEGFIGSVVDVLMTSYGTVAALAEAGSLDPDADYPDF